MNTIKFNNNNEIIIKNSKFITYLYKVYSNNDINKYFKEIKDKYPDASHYCYAYIINNQKKSSDDNEPSGTAGTPILQVMEMKNLNYTLCIVIRYFGGIKLGSNGLIRAYSKSISNCLNNNILIELEKGFNINISFNYNNIKQIDYLLKDYEINNKTFNQNIIYNLNVNRTGLQKIKEIKNIELTINKSIDIEKK